MANQVTDNEGQKDDGESDASPDANKVCINWAKMKLISFISNPGEDQHNQDKKQFEGSKDALKGAAIVALATDRPRQVPSNTIVQVLTHV